VVNMVRDQSADQTRFNAGDISNSDDI